jgi:hypothetical protein
VAERMGIVPELRRRGHRFTDARAVAASGRTIARPPISRRWSR